MKILVIAFLMINIQLYAQSTIAKLKYEDAEKAFYEKKYTESIENLDEVESILGQIPPNTLHLKILAQYEILKSNSFNDYNLIAELRANCNIYLEKFDIQGLEEKYKDIYIISENMLDYPNSKEEFIAKSKQKEVEDLNKIKQLLEKSMEIRGGLEAISNVKSIYFKGMMEVDGAKNLRFHEEKYMGPKKISKITSAKKGGKNLIMKVVQNGDFTLIEALDQYGRLTNQKSEKVFIPEASINFYSEKLLYDKLNDPNYSFELSSRGNTKTITMISGSSEIGFIKHITTYGANGLPSVVSVNFIEKDGFTISHSKTEKFSDYRAIEGILLAHHISREYQFLKKSIFNISEVIINQGVDEVDFK
ncbi:MAG: hypothetical protein RQ875_02220 [Vicingaceae bacterium]|nr:hypothetical protein [Vicingaceae bacterium]